MRLVLCLSATLLLSAVVRAQSIELLDGKLKLDTSGAFVEENDATALPQAIASFKARNSDGWGAITRGTRGLQPDGLATYMQRKVAEYTQGLSWLPKLNWLKREIVTIDGRRWADLRFIAPRQKPKNPRDGLLYTRVLATSYQGQLLEIMFTSNTDPSPALKDKIDKVIESVTLTE